jgi:hypothetical protein
MKVVQPGTKMATVFGTEIEVPDYDAAVENLRLLKAAWKAASEKVSAACARADGDLGWVTEEDTAAVDAATAEYREIDALMRQQAAILPYELSV